MAGRTDGKMLTVCQLDNDKVSDSTAVTVRQSYCKTYNHIPVLCMCHSRCVHNQVWPQVEATSSHSSSRCTCNQLSNTCSSSSRYWPVLAKLLVELTFRRVRVT